MNAQLSARESQTITLGDWIITLIVLAIPIVGIVMLFVWGFSGSTPPSKQNYCRAALIIALAMFVLVFLIAIMGGFAALALFHNAGGTSL